MKVPSPYSRATRALSGGVEQSAGVTGLAFSESLVQERPPEADRVVEIFGECDALARNHSSLCERRRSVRRLRVPVQHNGKGGRITHATGSGQRVLGDGEAILVSRSRG